MSNKIKTVKRLSQRYKNFSFSELMTKADEEFLESIIEMDSMGNILFESKFDNQGELEEKNTLTYTTEGKLLEHILHYAMDDMSEKRLLKRDEKGRLLEETKYYGEESGEKTSYEYNEKDNLSAIIEYDEDGQFISREAIKYDEKGGVAERIKTDEKNDVIERILFEKTNDDKVILEKEFGADGELRSVSTIAFDENGKEISIHQSSPDGKLMSGVLTSYDEKGNVLERKYKELHGKIVKYEYDENDRIVTQEIFDNSGLLLRKNIYEYDESGNLLAEQTFEMDNSRGTKEKHFGTRYEYEFYE